MISIILHNLFLSVLIGPLFSQVDYNTEIQPIFYDYCTNCHGGAGGLNLSNYDYVMDGGNSGEAVIPGNHENSLLWQYVNSGFMPPGNTDLTQEEIDLIADWIEEGALPEVELDMELNLTFQRQQNIFPSFSDEKFPDMISDNSGNLHIVWMEQSGSGKNITYVQSSDEGDSFSEPIRVNSVSGHVIAYTQSGPQIREHNGELYVVYMDNRNGLTMVYMNKSADNGQSWGEDKLISDQSYMQMYPDFEIDSQGMLHLIFYNFNSNHLIQDVRYATLAAGDSDFSPSRILGITDEVMEPCDCCQADITISDSDDLYMVYRNNISNTRDTYLMVKNAGETEFSFPTPVSTHNDYLTFCPSSGPTISIENENIAVSYVVSQDSDAFINFTAISDLSFTNEIWVNDTEAAQNYPFVRMHGENIHSVWVDQSEGNPDIFYGVSKIGSGLMSNLQRVNLNSEDSYILQADPMLHWAGNSLYCLWSDKRSGDFQVYMARADLFPDYPHFELTELSFEENEGDFDQLFNPGETISMLFDVEIPLFWPLGAEDIFVTISTEIPTIIIDNEEIYISELQPGESFENTLDPILISLDNSTAPGSYPLLMEIESDILQEFSFNFEVSLNQFGFPVPSPAMIKSSPLVVDFDNNGTNEIIYCDYNGFVHIINSNGTEFTTNFFPFEAGDQIWASPATADLDLDGNSEIIIASKSNHLFIFDKDGLKLDYDAELYLIGTPAIGNLDDDAELEIVFSGYSNDNKVFALNVDGSNVDGFPLELGEKVKAGIALADFNNNGRDDLVIGTDDDHIYLVYDSGETAPGFPFLANDKVQAAPIVLEVNGEKIIFAGCNDDNLYAINSDGSLRFTIQTGNKIQSSPSVLIHDENPYIFFGSNDDNIYAVDIEGNSFPGWPLNAEGAVVGSILFSDLDSDGETEVIASTDVGEIKIYNLDGSSYYPYSILNEAIFTSSALVQDIDNDGDLEILAGSANSLFVLDVKESGNSDGYWNIFRGSPLRNGYYAIGEGCGAALGDVSGDDNINILDLVQIVNLILGIDSPVFTCAADFTQDGAVNILDLVQIANYILDSLD